jgi:hypothetical protein
MVRKGQVRRIGGRDMRAQATVVASYSMLPPDLPLAGAIHGPLQILQHNPCGRAPATDETQRPPVMSRPVV